MTHLRIELNNILENVSSAVIEKLYELATSGTLDASSNLAGNIHVTATCLEYVDGIRAVFPDLTISKDKTVIFFLDPEVRRVMVLLYGSNGLLLTDDMVGVTALTNNLFNGNTTIQTFNELGNLRNITNGGYYTFKGCTNLTSIDLSNIAISGEDMCSGCTSLTSVNLSSIATLTSGYRAGYHWGGQFDGCTSLSSVILPQSGGIHIPSKCFTGCPITSINLECVGSMGVEAFNNISVDPIYLPNATILDGCCLPKTNTIKNYYFNSVIDLSLRYKAENNNRDYYYNNNDDRRSYCFFKSWEYLDKSIDVMYFRDLLSLSCFALQFCTIQHLIINNTTPPTLIGNNGDANDNVQDHIFYKCNIDNLYVPDSAVTAYLTAWSGTAINKSGSTYSLLNIIKPLSQCPKKTLAEVLNGLIGLIEAYM